MSEDGDIDTKAGSTDLVQSRGFTVLRESPFAGVPSVVATPEDLAVGPPVDADTGAVTPGDGPWTLFVATAMQSATPAQVPLVETAFRARSEAALADAYAVRMRPLADQVALLEVEYAGACAKYYAAENDRPDPRVWHNPQHLLEAMKVHERRMDRLQRGMRDTHERLIRAIQLLEDARGGTKSPARAVGVEFTATGPGTSHVRAVAK